MKKVSQRATRVGDQIQKELADLLRNEVKDPRVGPVTVTHVDVTSDLSHATVHFTHLAGRDKADETLAALARTSGFLRSALSHRLDLYSVPQLHFVYDDSIESGMRISQLIDDAIQPTRNSSPDRDRASAAHPARAPACRRRAAARQALGTVVERGAAARQARVRRRKGRPHGNARSARLGLAAAVLRRGDQVRAVPARRRPSATRPRCASASRRPPATPKATSSRRARSRWRAPTSNALSGFTGRLTQIPPAYSALKFEGRNHYEYARAGIDVPRQPRDIEILELALLAWNSPDAVLDVVCSKGTYMRVLAEDIGRALGLRRASGGSAPDRHRRIRDR